MANPKYADLPGIASDQPDVYETNDLPEAEQISAEAYEDQSETVEKLSVSAPEAFSKFHGHTLDATQVDFTDRIRKTPKSGYGVTSGDWEMLGSSNNENETPEQRFLRLQHETQELMDTIIQLKETAKEDEQNEKNTIIPLVQRMEQLQLQLSDLNLQKALGSEMIANLTDPHGALQKKLINEIEGFKSVSTNTKESNIRNTPQSISDGIIYELHYKPEQEKLGTLSKMADLEQRIKKLESVLGTDSSKLRPSLLTSSTSDKSVLAAIDTLSSKLSLVDPSTLEQIEARIASLLQHLQQIGDKKSKVEELDKQNKVSELYELVKKTEVMGASLPLVVERLEGLQELHEQALQFSKTLTQLDNVQQQIVDSLKSGGTQLKEIQDTFVKNTEMIKKNVSNLEERISKLKK